MIEHLKHMANTRPDGPDKDAVQWAISEIIRLQLQNQSLLKLIGDIR